MADISLLVNGKDYAGWQSARVTRSIESVAGSFDLEVSDRWADQETPWPIFEEDECVLKVGSTRLITGYVDKRSLSYEANARRLSVSGRDRAGDLVDSSAILSKWEFKGMPVLELARNVAKPFGISVSLQAGLTNASLPSPPKKHAINPGDSAFEVIEQACRLAGLLPVSDGNGGLVLTRAGKDRCSTELVQGENILAASADFDASARFRTYLVLGQHSGTDKYSGAKSSAAKGTAEDKNVRRSARKLLIRPDVAVTAAHAKQRAEWEASVRAARGDSVSVTVKGWQQGNGQVWPVNALVRVRSPLIGVDGEMLITQATFSVDSESGTRTVLSLKNPQSFMPEVLNKGDGNHYWKEIVRGV